MSSRSLIRWMIAILSWPVSRRWSQSPAGCRSRMPSRSLIPWMIAILSWPVSRWYLRMPACVLKFFSALWRCRFGSTHVKWAYTGFTWCRWWLVSWRWVFFWRWTVWMCRMDLPGLGRQLQSICNCSQIISIVYIISVMDGHLLCQLQMCTVLSINSSRYCLPGAAVAVISPVLPSSLDFLCWNGTD